MLNQPNAWKQPTTQNTMTDRTSYSFVVTDLDVKCDLPYEIVPGYVLRRAKDEQMKRILPYLEAFEKLCYCPPYFFEIAQENANEGGTYKRELLAQEKWRFHVVEYHDKPGRIIGIVRAGALSEVELRLGPTFFCPGGVYWHPPSFFSYISDVRLQWREPVVLEKKHLEQIGELHTRIEDTETTYPDIRRAIDRFISLRALPPGNEFYVLGLFTIIELLIAHHPKSTAAEDSLTHQIKTKIPLLSHRFDKPLDYSTYFRPAKESKIWSSLYDCRSKIAHGKEPMLSSGRQILKDEENVAAFLKEAVKTLLRYALHEPQLCLDLKAC